MKSANVKKKKETKMTRWQKVNVLILVFCAVVCAGLGVFFNYKWIWEVTSKRDENAFYSEEDSLDGKSISYIESYKDGGIRYDSTNMAYRMLGVCPCYRDENEQCTKAFVCQADESIGREEVPYYLDDAPEELVEEAEKRVAEENRYESLRNASMVTMKQGVSEVEAMMFYVFSGVFLVAAVVYLLDKR